MAGIPRYDDGAWRAAAPSATRSWVQRVLLSVGVLAALGCLVASAFVAQKQEQIETFARTDVETAHVVEGEPQNWLIVGSDTRDVIDDKDPGAGGFLAGGRANSSGRRSDTIMIVRVDPVAETIALLSLPRDLWLPIAGTNGSDRINSAYSHEDGPQRLIDTIKQNLNVDIHHFVEIDFQSFSGIVDAVGGVPMYFDRNVRDQHTGLYITDLGCTTLNGEQALQYARSRYLEVKNDNGRWEQDPTSDYGRMSRQQFFMRRMFDKAASSAGNPATLNELIGIAHEHVELDDSIDVGEAAGMAKKFGSFKGDSIKSYTLPVDEVSKGGAAVLQLVEEPAGPILNVFRGLTEHDVDPRRLEVKVANATGVPGRSTQIVDALKALDYKAVVASDLPAQPRTLIRFGFAGENRAAQVERHLTAGAELRPDPDLQAGEVVLIAGADFTTVMKRPRPWAPLALPDAAVGGTTVPEASTTTTTRKGQKTTTTKAPTTTTTAVPTNYNVPGHTVGKVPGDPPDGIECE